MLEALLIYSLSLYLVYHVVSRSDLLTKPRAWAFRMLPGWLTYPLTCALCATWWMGIAGSIVGLIVAPWWMLLAAPVVNMVLDLIVKALMRANESPVMGEGKTVTSGDQSITTWSGPTVVTVRASSDLCAGELVKVAHGDGFKIHPSDPWWKTLGGTQPPPTWLASENAPEGWEQVNRDNSIRRTSGFVRWWPGKLVGRKVRVVTGPRAGQTGTIDNGDGPAVFRSGMDVTPWTYLIKPDLPVVEGPEDPRDGRIKVLARDCILLDEPFNPLAHEQTK